MFQPNASSPASSVSLGNGTAAMTTSSADASNGVNNNVSAMDDVLDIIMRNGGKLERRADVPCTPVHLACH